MSDAVVRVQTHLHEIAREHWEAQEDRHARDLAWLRAELELVARSLEIRGVKIELNRPTPAAFASDYGLPRPHKKRKLSTSPRMSANETRTGVGVGSETAVASADTEGGALSSDPIDLTHDRVAEETRAANDAVQASSSSSSDRGVHTQGVWKQSVDGHDHDKRRSRKRGRPRESEADPLRMRVIDLRTELRKRGLRTTGNKPALLSRLLDDMTTDGERSESSKGGFPDGVEPDEEEEENLHVDDTSDAEAGRSDGYEAGTSASHRESDSDVNCTEAQESTPYQEEADAIPTLTHGRQNRDSQVADATDETQSDGHSSGVSTATRDRRGEVARSFNGGSTAGATKRSTSSEMSLKVVPTGSVPPRQEPTTQRSIADLPLKRSNEQQRDAESSLSPTIRSNAVEHRPLSLQGEGHSTPRDQIVPSSYSSHADVSAEKLDVDTRDHEYDANAESAALSAAATHVEAPVDVASRATVPNPMSWLHSRAKKVIQAFTESTDASASNSSLSARAFRAFQGAIVSDSAADASRTTNEQLSQSASKVANAGATSPVDSDNTPTPNLRTTTSLPARGRDPSLKVTFSHSDAVDTIAEEPRTDESAIEDTNASTSAEAGFASHMTGSMDGRMRSVSLPKTALSREGVQMLANTPDSSLSSNARSHEGVEKAKSAEADKSDEARRRREYQEIVDREAQRLRMAAKLSAQKRIEEAKATKTYWEKYEHLKLRLQAESETSTVAGHGEQTASSVSTPDAAVAPLRDAREENTGEPAAAVVSTDSAVQGVGAKPRAESTVVEAPKLLASTRSRAESTVVEAPKLLASTRSRADSMSSTVSSVSNSSGSAKSFASSSATANSTKQAPPNLVSGIHSLTALIHNSKDATASTSTRSVPVVNSLKLAEKTRQQEEKKRAEKAKRKEALVKKYEEQRKLDEKKKEDERRKREAQEKAERDAKLKREQERVEAKKKRELELAHKRREKLQEMKRRAADREKEKALATANMTAKVSAAPSSALLTDAGPLVPPPRPTKPRPAKVAHPSSSKPKPEAPAQAETAASSTAAPRGPPAAASQQTAAVKREEPVASYDMSDQDESDESDDEEDETKTKRRRRTGKNIPAWAQRENLDKILRVQFGPNAVDPTPSIFPDFADTCDLEAIFDSSDARRKKRFGRRTSSGNWFGDRPTARDRAAYRRDMGFNR